MSSESEEKVERAIRLAERRLKSGLHQRGRIRYLAEISPDGDGAFLEPLPLSGVEQADPAPVDANLAFAAGQAIGAFGYRLRLSDSTVIPDVLQLLQHGGHIPFGLDSRFTAASPGERPVVETDPDEPQRSNWGCLIIVCGPDGCYGYCDYCP
jgi:hypothetical protein